MLRDTIIYYYPKGRDLSFTYIAERHIELLRSAYAIYDSDLSALPTIAQTTPHTAIIHPYFYPLTTLGEIKETIYKQVRRNLRHVIAVDVADSDRISQWAVEMVNMADAAIVNSKWSYDAYVGSGVKVPVYVVPHGLEDIWFRPQRKPTHPVIKMIYDIKQKRRPLILGYFLWHSGWRKGADLVVKLLDCLESARVEYLLVVKKMNITDPAFVQLSRYKMFVVEGKLARDWLIDLYDVFDILLLPSRGGSFEMSGLEALARGVPVLMPNVGAWTEYTPPGLGKYLWVKTARMVEPLPGNTIHNGRGAEWDSEDACLKTIEIWANYDEVKSKVMAGVEWIKKNYSWEAQREKIVSAVRAVVGY